jgi:hypothetical protein
LVLCTAWPVYKDAGTLNALADVLKAPLAVLDADRTLKHWLGTPNIAHHAVGTPEVLA